MTQRNTCSKPSITINPRKRRRSDSISRFIPFLLSFLTVFSCLSSIPSTGASAGLHSSNLKSTFDESLTLKPLPDGKLLAFFSFKLDSIQSFHPSDSDSDPSKVTNETLSFDPLKTQNFNLLPRQLIQIARSRNVKDLHLSLNTGRWDYLHWGYPIFNVKELDEDGKVREVQVGEENVASGAEMWANLIVDQQTSRQNSESSTLISKPLLTRWRSLASSLAGLFCASLDALDSKVTLIPKFPEIFHSSSSPSSSLASSSSPSTSSDKSSRKRSSSTLTSTSNLRDLDVSTKLLHGFLPTENICTENLTPFLKSLPCKNKAGLASLLTPHELFGAGFHGMSIHLWKINQVGDQVVSEMEEQDGVGMAAEEVEREIGERGWKVELNFQVVFSPALRQDIGRRDWSLSSLFRKKLETSCPLADTSIIRVLKPPSATQSPDKVASSGIKQLSMKDRFVLEPLPTSRIPSSDVEQDEDGNHDEEEEEEEEDGDEKLETLKENQRREENRIYERLNKNGNLIYDVSDLSRFEDGILDLSMTWPGESVFEYPHQIQPPPITAERSFKGYGQESGTIELIIRNNQIGKEVNVLYFEQLPWFVKPLLHTMKTEVIEDEFDEDSPIVHFTDDLTLPILNSINYQPSVPRESPSLIEANLRIPASSQVILTFRFEKGFLRYMEHPPDAHRGFDLPPAIIKVLETDPKFSPSSSSSLQVYGSGLNSDLNGIIRSGLIGKRQGSTRGLKKRIPKIFTTTSLVELAVPDFSMPYNVIIMTSTVIALFFGSVFNNLVRSYKDLVVDV